MKFKATKKEMKSEYSTIIGIGYCNAQHLLQYEEPTAYSTRTEGWACDYYDIGGVLISTGYSHIDSKNANCKYDTVHEYDNKAQAIVLGSADYETKKQQVREILKEFINECTK